MEDRWETLGDIGRHKQRVLERAGVIRSRWESLGVSHWESGSGGGGVGVGVGVGVGGGVVGGGILLDYVSRVATSNYV